jgi:hypothetical protein
MFEARTKTFYLNQELPYKHPMKSHNKTHRTGCVAHCEFGLRITPRFSQPSVLDMGDRLALRLGGFAFDEERPVPEE